MTSLKNRLPAKVLAVVLCGLFLGEWNYGLSQGTGQDDPLAGQFKKAKTAYLAGDFGAALNILDPLITSLAGVEGRKTFKGETFLLAGATYEKMKVRNLAVRYYCQAKEILGEGKTIEGLDLKDLAFYKENCAGPGAAGGAARETGPGNKNSFVRILGIALAVAAFGGVIWYLFFSKNAVFKKKAKYTSITFKLTVTYKGFNSTGTRRLWLAGENVKDEAFSYTQDCQESTKCQDAVQQETYAFTRTVTSDNFIVKQEFLNWDYYSLPGGTGWKKLCSDYTLEVEKYSYGDGKDPGKPNAKGLETLNQPIVVDRDCEQVSARIHNCTIQATVAFSTPSSAGRGGRAASAAMVSVHHLD